MPIEKYFHGHGKSVLKELIKRHGKKKGTSIFYATANKRHQNPGDK